MEGDTSPKVRTWLAEAEHEEDRLRRELGRVEAEVQRRPLHVHPNRVTHYLEDLRHTLEKGGVRARQLLQGDIERINVHLVLDAAKPFARAEIISTGKGLLDRVAFVVAGACNHRYQTRSSLRWI
jgi:G3E family GTPase